MRADVLSATLVGRLGFSVGDRPVVTNSRKADAMLAYLCLAPGATLARETATGLLWGDKPDLQARSSLRQTIFLLNNAFRAVGFTGLDVQKSHIALLPDRFDTDLAGILSSATADVPLHPKLLHQSFEPSLLLQGLDHLDEQFSVWLNVQRQTVHDRIRSGLERRLARCTDQETAEEIAQALLNLDPSHEPACRALMTIRARTGDQTGALRVYEALWHHLESEYDTEPTAETQELVARIKLGGFADAASPPVPALVPAQPPAEPVEEICPRILISEVDVLNVSGTNGFVASVFRHDLMSRMVRFREWTVIESAHMSPGQIQAPAFQLSSSAIIEDEKLYISLTLHDIHSGRVIWGDNYRVDVATLFSMQPEIVARIALGVNIHASREQLARCMTAPELSLQHYNRWLLGQQHHFQHLPEDYDRAITIYRSLIEERPAFAPAYSSLAQTMHSRHLVYVGEHRSRANLEEASGLVRAAQSLDPFDSRSHLCAAWNAMMTDRFDDAETNLHLAYDLNENDPWTVVSVATGLAFCGNTRLASDLARRALKLKFVGTPVQWGYLTGLWFLCGDYAAAADAYHRAGQGFFHAAPWGIAALVETGDMETARQRCQALLESSSRRWTAGPSPTRQQVAKWVAQCFPVADDEARERLVAGLASAGLPPV